MKKKQTYKNIAMNIVAFGVQFVINLYISPILVSKVGTSAYGFIGLANDFVSYASILATVFNSVASRFIANAFYKEDYESANKYFNSLIVANLVLASVLGIVGTILVPNLNKMLSIPTSIVYDVKLTFALIFVSYIISLTTLVFTTATFVTNRTDIQGVRNIVNCIVRFAFIIIFLNFVSIRIYWIALATLIANVVVTIMNINLTIKLTPEIKINLKYAKRSYAFELAKSGCWMAFTSISVILLRGLDLTVANILLGDYEMGLLSIARTMPNNMTSIVSTIAPIFTPVFIAFYAKKNIKGLFDSVNKSITTMAMILFVPISGFIVFSHDFYSLWQTSLSDDELMIVTILSTITIVQSYFDSTTSTMAQLSVVTNKLKIPVFVSFGCGIVSVIVEIFLITTTELGIYSIVLSTTIVMLIRYIMFNSIYAAYCLGQPRTCFFPIAFKSWLSIPILIATMSAIKIVMPIHSWLDFCVDIFICGFLGYVEMLLMYNRKEVYRCINKKMSKKNS